MQTPWKTSGSSEIQGTAILLIVSETLDLNFSERKTQSRPVTGPPIAEAAGDGRRQGEGAWLLGLTFPTLSLPHLPITLAG